MAHQQIEHILTNLNSLKSTPVAIQALLDGDTTGWFIHFSAIADNAKLHPLGVLSDGGDIRLFTGQIPPWPEASATQLARNQDHATVCWQFTSTDARFRLAQLYPSIPD